jgi:hypothetical protein
MSYTDEDYARADIASDFHKDVFGVRPSLQRYPEDHLAAHKAASNRFDELKATPTGRQMLREDGWIIKEP